MKCKSAPAVLLLVAAIEAFAAPPNMKDYARGVTVDVPLLQPLVETTLPDEVYQIATRTDLHDLRVFNASGVPVAHAFCTAPSTSTPVVTQQSLPVFELREPRASGSEGSRVEVHTSSGTQVSVEEGGVSGDRAARPGSHIIDARGIEQALRAIQFDWQSPDGASTAKVSIQASDDLDRWSVVVTNSTLLRTAQGGEELRRERIELPPRVYKYLRVARSDGGEPLEINGVIAELVSAVADIEPLWFMPTLVADPEPGTLQFDTARIAPVAFARLRLQQENSSVRVTLHSRADAKSSWTERWRGEVYLIASEGEQRASPPARFDATTDRYWRVVLPKDSPVQPSLDLGYRPLRLRFLGQGPAPFTIAFGSRRAPAAAAASCDGLIGDVSTQERERLVSEGYIGGLRTLGGDMALQPAPKPTPVRLIILWSVLIAGVGVLVAMALSLLKRLRTPPA